jgi:hypothetical protein
LTKVSAGFGGICYIQEGKGREKSQPWLKDYAVGKSGSKIRPSMQKGKSWSCRNGREQGWILLMELCLWLRVGAVPMKVWDDTGMVKIHWSCSPPSVTQC